MYRLIAKLILFAIFGLGGVINTLFIFPIIYLLPVSIVKKQLYSKYVIHKSFALFVKLLVWLNVVGFKVENKELLETKSQLIIANHPSLIDVVILISLVKKADCIIKKSLFRNPFMAVSVMAAGYIGNDTTAILSQCKHSLEEGNSLIIFPEGTRTEKDDESLKFQRGAANIALFCGSGLTPVTINCTTTFLDKDQKWYEFPFEKPHFYLKVLPIFPIHSFQKYEYASIASRKLTLAIEQYFTAQIRN